MKSGWALAVPIALLLVGCTPTAPPSTAPPTPTFMCTPEAGGAESACSQQDYDKMKAKDALYAEAETVYREYQAEYERVIRAGGASNSLRKLRGVLGDPEDSERACSRNSRTSRLRPAHRGARDRGRISHRRRPGIEMNGSVVAMEFCMDASSTRVIEEKRREVRDGVIARDECYFRPDGSQTADRC